MLKDSVRARRPGTELYEAACMQLLREQLGFADASVEEVTINSPGETRPQTYLSIKLIEPLDRQQVRWLRTPLDTFRVLRPQYASLVIPITDSMGTFLAGRFIVPLQLYGRGEAVSKSLASAPANIRSDFDRLRRFLNEHRTEADLVTALTALRTDGEYLNRMIAVAILANFSDRDSTWWALTDALRDPQEVVRIAAKEVLNNFSPRYVSWKPASESLRALLGGTNVVVTEQVLWMLAATKVDPALARPLLRGNGFWILSHLGAENLGARSAARAALVQFRGRDLGPSRVEWARWIAGL